MNGSEDSEQMRLGCFDGCVHPPLHSSRRLTAQAPSPTHKGLRSVRASIVLGSGRIGGGASRVSSDGDRRVAAGKCRWIRRTRSLFAVSSREQPTRMTLRCPCVGAWVGGRDCLQSMFAVKCQNIIRRLCAGVKDVRGSGNSELQKMRCSWHSIPAHGLKATQPLPQSRMTGT
jgi:hypothetical protein